jgi:hypothetical protein
MLVYGDGNAKGTVSFLNGLVVGRGQYLDTSGQPSSYDVLESEVYNNYTYELTLEKEIAKYRDTLLSLLHPAGMKVVGRFVMKSNNNMVMRMTDTLSKGIVLGDYLYVGAGATMSTNDWYTYESNLITVTVGEGGNLMHILTSNSTVEMVSNSGDVVFSKIVSYDRTKIYLDDYTWLIYPDVAYVTANAGSNVINIQSLTGSYNIVNNGVYTDPSNPLKDIVKADADYITVGNNNAVRVQTVDYTLGIIYTYTNLTYAATPSLMSVKRSLTANAFNIKIYTTPQVVDPSTISTEDGDIIITENGDVILL